MFKHLLVVLAVPLSAQTWDVPGRAADFVSEETQGKLKIGFEQRERYESRTGNGFGKDVDVATVLARTRFSLTYQTGWLKLSGMVQDSRAPGYGPNPPGSVQDTTDLQQAYVELFPQRKSGFGMTLGRMMLNYGDGRIIGTPQWGNCSRTYDQARVFFGNRRVRLDALFVTPVKVQADSFNRPVLGDRVWGVYSSFPDIWRKFLLDVYALRHDQNRPGGFMAGNKDAATDRLGVNTLGIRWVGPAARGVTLNVEAVAQNGRIGSGDHRATAWSSSVSRRWTVHRKPLDLSAEYRFASGARNPKDASVSRTFDQLYAAHHDRFGHQDLLGWRNIKSPRTLASYGVGKAVVVNAMYSNFWLASACDSLYNGSGKAIARSTTCAAGTHVGQEADVYGVFKYKRFQIGAGYGYLVPGRFIQQTTPGVSPSYVYIFHSYSL